MVLTRVPLPLSASATSFERYGATIGQVGANGIVRMLHCGWATLRRPASASWRRSAAIEAGLCGAPGMSASHSYGFLATKCYGKQRGGAKPLGTNATCSCGLAGQDTGCGAGARCAAASAGLQRCAVRSGDRCASAICYARDTGAWLVPTVHGCIGKNRSIEPAGRPQPGPLRDTKEGAVCKRRGREAHRWCVLVRGGASAAWLHHTALSSLVHRDQALAQRVDCRLGSICQV